jgi:hypothetical protein
MHGRKNSLGKNIDYMMELVEEYLNDKIPRVTFELNFESEILDRYKKMVKENKDFAEWFYDMLSEEGVDVGDTLSDREFKQLIEDQYDKVKGFTQADLL